VSLLRNLLLLGDFDEIAPDKTIKTLTDEQLEEFMHSLVKFLGSGFDREVIDQAFSSLKMPAGIANREARITHFCSDYFDRLTAVGWG